MASRSRQGPRAQGGVRGLCARRRRGRATRHGAEVAGGRLRRRLSGARRDRARDRPAPVGGLADPGDRRRAPGLGQHLQEALRHRRRRHRLGGRDRLPAPDQRADAGRARIPNHGALCHAGGDRDAARRCGRQHRRVAGGRGGDRLRRAGGHGVRHRRRRQEADRLPLLYDRRRGLAGSGRRSATSPPASMAPGRRRRPPTSWSISSMR